MSTPPALSIGPIYRPLSIWTRAVLSIKVHIFRTLTRMAIPILTSSYVRGRASLPTFIKSYPSHPSLMHRVFIPPSYKPDDAPLPLYLSIHGGGFVLGNPAGDDPFCHHFSKFHNLLVISLDYPKAPSSPFPSATNALIDTVAAILNDESLPFDRSKVAIGGFSAGGNLALSLAQDPSLQGKIHGICAFYPPCNFVTPISVSLAARPANAGPDGLKNMAPLFNYAYLPPETDLCDPRLSVAYAKRENLPEKICVVGCEFDMLCYDAELMAERWAGKERKEGEYVWEKDGIRWEKVLGVVHGFESMDGRQERDNTKREKNLERGRKMWDDAAEWLHREIYR
ncbi:hypothetical protein ACMFMG_007597 [Clarireedia jacksonii]